MLLPFNFHFLVFLQVVSCILTLFVSAQFQWHQSLSFFECPFLAALSVFQEILCTAHPLIFCLLWQYVMSVVGGRMWQEAPAVMRMPKWRVWCGSALAVSDLREIIHNTRK